MVPCIMIWKVRQEEQYILAMELWIFIKKKKAEHK